MGAAAGAVTLSGCTSDLPFLGDDASGYTAWIPAGDGRITVDAMVPSELVAVDGIEMDDAGVFRAHAAADVDTYLFYQGARATVSVMEGEFPASEQTAYYESSDRADLEAAGSYGGYDLYESSAGGLYGLQEGTTVIVRDGAADPRGALERFVDVGSGDGSRLVDADDDFATLVDAANGNHWSLWYDPNPDDAVLGGITAYDFAAGESGYVHATIFETEDAVDASSIDESHADWEPLTEYGVSTDGRLVVVDGTVVTEAAPIRF